MMERYHLLMAEASAGGVLAVEVNAGGVLGLPSVVASSPSFSWIMKRAGEIATGKARARLLKLAFPEENVIHCVDDQKRIHLAFSGVRCTSPHPEQCEGTCLMPQ